MDDDPAPAGGTAQSGMTLCRHCCEPKARNKRCLSDWCNVRRVRESREEGPDDSDVRCPHCRELKGKNKMCRSEWCVRRRLRQQGKDPPASLPIGGPSE